MLCVAGGEVRALKPGLEVRIGPPLGDDEAHVPVVVGPQQLEPLEAFGGRNASRASGEALFELGEPIARDGEGVDLDDAHPRRFPPWRRTAKEVQAAPAVVTGVRSASLA